MEQNNPASEHTLIKGCISLLTPIKVFVVESFDLPPLKPDFNVKFDIINHLYNNIELLTNFIMDVSIGKHKQWNIYKTLKGITLSKTFKGRSIPTKKSLPKHQNSYKWGVIHEKEKRCVGYFPQLHLEKCKTEKEKLAMIMDSDCSPDIKVDLLEIHIKP